MSTPETLKEYAGQLGYPNSKTVKKLLSMLFDSDEKIQIADALPGTVAEISDKTGFSKSDTKVIIDELHKCGAINLRMHQNGTYRLFPGMIELRDAVVVTPGVSSEVIQLWDYVVRNELPEIVPLLEKMGIPPMMRVIPIEEAVESQGKVLDADSARKILEEADQIMAIPCVCRKTAKDIGRSPDCPAPEDVNLCMMINGFADEGISRNIGEILTNKEAIRRLELAEDAGLVHLTRNNIKKDMIMCNCCACCCTGLFMINEINYPSFAPSRFRVKLDEDECTGCETCMDRCQFLAIEVNDIAKIDLEKCFGCGVCVPTCPGEALLLEEIRPKEFIRVT